MASRDGLSIDINAHKFAGMVVTIVRCHQIPVVIPGPSRGTLVGRRDHHLGTTWLDVTHGARSILVIKIFAKAWEIVCLILCAVYRSCPLPALDLFVIDRVVGKTNKIRASTMVPIITTSHYTYQNTAIKEWKAHLSEHYFFITIDCSIPLYLVTPKVNHEQAAHLDKVIQPEQLMLASLWQENMKDKLSWKWVLVS